MVGAADFADQLSVKTWKRRPAQVIVLHETDVAALFVTDLVRTLRKDGWTIVTADEAYRDPISKLAPDVPSANGPCWSLPLGKRESPSRAGTSATTSILPIGCSPSGSSTKRLRRPRHQGDADTATA